MGTVGPKIGFGPIWLQPWMSKIKKCSERTVNGCEPGVTDGCCTVIPCKLCLVWEAYGEDPIYGTADWNGEQWIGDVLGFVAYWRRAYYDNGCEFVVEVGGEIVAVLEKCYDVTCRDPSGEVAISVGYVSGTLSWRKAETRPLTYTTSDGCVVNFCGNCECTCGHLCYTLTTAAPNCTVCVGELPDISYSECDPPAWEATVPCGDEEYEIAMFLRRDDDTGECLVGGSINGEALEDAVVSDCTGIDVIFTTYDGTTLRVTCDPCRCDTSTGCEVGCCWPVAYNDYYPCGYYLPLPFHISAPGCDIDGATGTFGHGGIPTAKGSCGSCSSAQGEAIGGTNGQLWVPFGEAYCNPTPCAIEICLVLECVDEVGTPYGLDECCGKMRLWVGTSVRMADDDGETPRTGPGGCAYWIKFSPDSCACLPDGGGFTGVFTIGLVLDCETQFTTGPCIGHSECCEPFCASFTLTV